MPSILHPLGTRARDPDRPWRRHGQPEGLIMVNHPFPIFGFGLVISGIVFLGILEATQPMKPVLVRERNGLRRETDSAAAVFLNSSKLHSLDRSPNE